MASHNPLTDWSFITYNQGFSFTATEVSATGPNKLIAELSRRGVIKVVGSYLVLLWLLAQGVADLFPAFGFPLWSVRAFVVVGIALTPLVFFLAWRYDLTAKGVVRDVRDKPPEPSVSETRRAQLQEHKSQVGFIQASWLDEDGEPVTRQFFSELVIGRDAGVDIRLKDRLVSRRQATVFPERGNWYINDLGSSNGTYVNGEKVSKARLPSQALLKFHPDGPQLDLQIRFMDETLSSPAVE